MKMPMFVEICSIKSRESQKGSKVKFKRGKVGAVLVTFLFAVLSTIFPNLAFAATDLNNAYSHTNNIVVDVGGYSSYLGCNLRQDITSTWQQYILNSTNTIMASSFNKALNGGSWAVNQYGPGNMLDVMIVWTETPNMEMTFNDLGYGGYYYTNLQTIDSTNSLHYAQISAVNPGCEITVTYGVMGNFIATQSENFNTVVGEFSSRRNLFVNNVDINYPPGIYDGTPIAFGAAPPKINGNVRCQNPNSVISAVEINFQSGLDRNAILSDSYPDGKDYYLYTLNESPYSLIVLCDGSPYYSATIEDNPNTLDNELYRNYHFMCAHEGKSNFCAAA